ncbi:aminotransferase class I/II-fold pyridoxal phosphate-dependent enzyme [Leptolyngbya sp. BL0902]|uniref:aminotransferase class I/II-fold pyridoxal phosphate-dependent enzyme n=1 Tax=Leptolyngbya sp. BL0902 TaxID=1115757 RepID=UPI0021F22CFF|nr:aminotransferase class I/II-fold pyridoxal phosphate-dependent enzyme [Leptolyngbya sp. BL0902]
MMLDQTQTPFLSALQICAQRPQAAFYTPGHKRGQGAPARLRDLLGEAALRADLPELTELDNLFAPEGAILQAQALAAAAFGAEQTYFLANGSTCGLEAAILAVCNPGDKILVPRNAHRSVVAGLVLAGARPVFVEPEYAPDLGLALGLPAGTVAEALAHHPDARAVLVVSPTYHGMTSDLEAIAAIAHRHSIPLLVDEAHGPHFAFHPDLPAPALHQGADLVVQSTHKVLSALSQASMLHVQGNRIDRDRLQAALQLTQSTSPNSLLLASLDAARYQMATEGKALLSNTLALAQTLREQLAMLPGLRVIAPQDVAAYASVRDLDLTRTTVDVAALGITGLEADEILNDTLGVTVELPELRHLTLVVSLGNTTADGDHCIEGFRQLVARCGSASLASPTIAASSPDILPSSGPTFPSPPFTLPPLSPREAFFAPTVTLPAAEALGHLSAETLSAYPPGIPTVMAGEEITAAALAHLATVAQQGGYVTGASDPTLHTLKVIRTPTPQG